MIIETVGFIKAQNFLTIQAEEEFLNTDTAAKTFSVESQRTPLKI
jgi:hypothetical protein